VYLTLINVPYSTECDRAFTRSDALAKHMRTVHQTEDLRPSDPVSKAHQSAGAVPGKTGKITKIVLKTPQSYSATHEDAGDDSSAKDDLSEDMFTPITEEAGFTREEIAMPIERLAKLCKLQVKWAEQEGESIREECQAWEQIYKNEFEEKEALFEQMVQVEQAWHQRRKAIVTGAANVRVSPEMLTAGISGDTQTIDTAEEA